MKIFLLILNIYIFVGTTINLLIAIKKQKPTLSWFLMALTSLSLLLLIIFVEPKR